MCKFRKYRHTWELCPECENEVKLKAELSVQKCPKCGKAIVACSMCVDMNCAECDLYEQAEKANQE